MKSSRSSYDHDPQNYVARQNLQSARIVQSDADEVASPTVPAAAAGLPHGALATVLAHNVEVIHGRHYFCRSFDYVLEEISGHGDGTPIDDDVDTHIEVQKVPADGHYDARFRITNNNGTLTGEMLDWFKLGTRETVRANRQVAGSELVEV